MVRRLTAILLIFSIFALPTGAVMRGDGGGGGGGGDVLLVGDDTAYTGCSPCGSIPGDRYYIFGLHTAGYEAVASGTPTKAYVRFNTTDSNNWKVCVFLDSDNSLLGCSDGVSGTVPGLNEDTFTTPGWTITSGTDYLIAVVADGYVEIQHDAAGSGCVMSSSCWWQYYYDSGGTYDFDSPPDPWAYVSGSSGKGNVTIYIEGTPP